MGVDLDLFQLVVPVGLVIAPGVSSASLSAGLAPTSLCGSGDSWLDRPLEVSVTRHRASVSDLGLYDESREQRAVVECGM